MSKSNKKSKSNIKSSTKSKSLTELASRSFTQSLSQSITLKPQLAPYSESISPSLGGVGGGIVVTITGRNFGDSSRVRSVLIGSSSCTILNFLSDSSVVCRTPPSKPGLYKVFVTVDNRRGKSIANFTYISPTIREAFPKILPVDSIIPSNRILTIKGQYLSGVDPSLHFVSIGGKSCPSVQLISDSEISCVTPPGVGKNVLVLVSINDVSSKSEQPVTIDYSTPSITTISPNTGSVGGGYNVTLIGSSFGYGQLGGTFFIYIGHQEISEKYVSLRSNYAIKFLMPEGVRIGTFRLVVSVAGQNSSSSLDVFSFTPEIQKIEPAFGQSGGGTVITVTGPFFANPSSVFIGNSGCSSPVLLDPKRIICTTPAGSGTAVGVYVVSEELKSSTVALWSYRDPVLSSINPSTGPAVGGTMVTVSGLYLGSVTPLNVQVTFASSTADIIFRNTSMIIVKSPTGLGKALPVRVQVGAILSNSLPWSYNPPEITTFVNPKRSSLPGLIPISIIGKNFGSYQFDQQATIDGKTCVPTTWVNDSLIVCFAPSRSAAASNLSVFVSVANVSSTLNEFSSFEYFSTGIVSILPPSGPVKGNFQVTITTENESSSSLSIIITDSSGKIHTFTANRQSENVYVFSILLLTSTSKFSAGASTIVASRPGKTYPAESYYFYDLIETISIQPKIGVYNTRTPVTITGSGFSPRLYSVIQLYFSPSTTPSWFTVLDENRIFSFTPDNISPGRYSVYISVAGADITSNMVFTYRTNPIPMSSVQYSNDLSSVVVNFESETNQGAFIPGKSTCSQFLNSTTLSIIGLSSTCLWSDYATLVIFPTTLPPLGSFITINSNSIVARGKTNEPRDIYPYSSGSLQLTVTETVKPTASLMGSTFGQCSPFYLDGSYSYGGKSTFQYKWELLYSVPPYQLDDLAALISTQKSSLIRILPSNSEIISKLPTDTDYVFRMTVTNIMGLSDSAIATVHRSQYDLPTGFVSGAQTTFITSNLPVTFTAYSIATICSGASISATEFSWGITTLNSTKISDFGISEPESHQRKLNFKEYVFLSLIGQNFKLDITIKDIATSHLAIYFVDVNVVEAEYAISLTGGNRTASLNDSVELVALGVDYDAFPGDFSYTWSCKDSRGVACKFTLPQQPTVVVNPSDITADTFFFSVTATKNARNITAYCFVRYQSGVVPTSKITILPSPDSLFPESAVYISTSTTNPDILNAKYTYSWSVVNDYLELTVDSVIMNSDKSGFTILPNQLQARVPYQFVLYTTDQFGNVGQSLFTITPNGPPIGGSFSTSPSMGTSFETVFSLIAADWEDKIENTPLSYAFYYQDPTSGMEPVLLIKSNNYYFDTFLPSGNLTLICEVSNRYGSTVQTALQVEVKRMQNVTGVGIITMASSMYSRSSDGYFVLYISNIGLQELGTNYIQQALAKSNLTLISLLDPIANNTLNAWNKIAKLPDTLSSVSSTIVYLSNNVYVLNQGEAISITINLATDAIKNVVRLESSKQQITSSTYKNFYYSINRFLSFTNVKFNGRTKKEFTRKDLTNFVLSSLETLGQGETLRTICGSKIYNRTLNQYSRFLFSAFSSVDTAALSTPEADFYINGITPGFDCMVGWVGWTQFGFFSNISDSYFTREHKLLSPLISAHFYLKNDSAIDDAFNVTSGLGYVVSLNKTVDRKDQPLCLHWSSPDLSDVNNSTCVPHYNPRSRQVTCSCALPGYIAVYAVKRPPNSSFSDSGDGYIDTILGTAIPVGLAFLLALLVIIVLAIRRRRKKGAPVDHMPGVVTFYDPINQEWAVFAMTE